MNMHDTVIDLMKEQNLQYMQQSLNSGKDPTWHYDLKLYVEL